MMESGLKEQSKGMESGKEYKENLILENGKMEKLKDMEFISGQMEIDMKGSGLIV